MPVPPRNAREDGSLKAVTRILETRVARFDRGSRVGGAIPAAARRTAERLVEVICLQDLDSEAVKRESLEKIESYVACLPRPVRLGLAAAFIAVDQGARVFPPARGRRFTELDAARADRYLGLLLKGRIRWIRSVTSALKSLITLCYYDVPEVRARVGYQPDPHIGRVARRRLERYREEIRRAEEAVSDGGLDAVSGPRPAGVITEEAGTGMLELNCDAVVVGSGAGGATMASELADVGTDVILVEEGAYHPTESFRTDAVRALRTLYRSGGAQTIVGRPPITLIEGRCVGGSTVVNGGMCWRTPADVLERWSRAEGIAAIAAGEMDRHFEKVEARLSVRPQEPDSIGRDVEMLRRGAEALDWKIDRSLRNQLYCGGCDNCLCGCPTGAKRSMLVTNVRRALARGARLITECRIDRVTHSGGVATGVEGRFVRPGGRSGRKVAVRAPVVVAACGAIQTPALLARSGLRSRALGRNLTVHPTAALVAIFDEEVRGWEGVHQAYQVTQFLHEGILATASTLPPASVASSLPQRGQELRELMQEYNRMVVAGCLVEDTGSGRVRTLPGVGPVASYRLTDRDANSLVRGLSHAAELMLAAGARRLILPIEGAPAPMEPDQARRFLGGRVRPEVLRLFTVHPMGTARMSGDAGRGVVSSFGELHGTSGVFATDASILPGPVRVNPMETICALAARNAARLIDDRERYGF